MNINECHGDIRGPVRLGNVKVDVEQLAEMLRIAAADRNLPLNVRTDTVRSGNLLFGTNYPSIHLSHPNPPASYFSVVIIIGESTINFKYYGYSKANYKHNVKEAHRADYEKTFSLGSLIKGALVNDNVMALQAEQVWQQEVLELIEELIIAH